MSQLRFLWVAVFSLCISLLASVSSGQMQAYIDQDFQNASLFKTSGIAPSISAPAAGGKWQGFDGSNFAIVQNTTTDNKPALQISRHSVGTLSLFANADPADNRDTTIRLDVFPGPTDETATVIRFRNRKQNKTVTTLRFDNDNIILAIANGKGNFGVRSRPQQWQQLELSYAPDAESIIILNRYADGISVNHTIPVENNLPIDTVEFVNSPSSSPDKPNTLLVRRIELLHGVVSSLAGRENVLLSAYDTKATVATSTDSPVAVGRLNDGDISNTSVEVVRSLPATLLFEMPQAVQVSTIRLFSGDIANVNNPSGEVAVTSFKVEGLSTASGQWRELLEVRDAPGAAGLGAELNDELVIARDFEPIEVSQLRITLIDSNDTGERADGSVPASKVAIVREVELYTHERLAGSRRQLNHLVNAEFVLPVYRDEASATLHAVVDESLEQEFEVEVTVRERHTNVVPAPARRVTLKPGDNRIDIPIADWEPGEYRTQLQAVGADAPVGGSFARLLRINRVAPAVAPAHADDLSGKKMFFPDAWYLQRHENVQFKIVPPELYRVGHTYLKPEKMMQLGVTLGFSADGQQLIVTLTDMTRDWSHESRELRYAVADLDDLTQWTIFDGQPEQIDSVATRLQGHAMASGGSDGLGYSFGDGQVFRFYDPAVDGPVPMDQVRVQYVGYRKVDWGVVQPPPQSTWVMWKKGNEWILLDNKPFLQDSISSDEFESPTNSNDNFAGQWLSDDGTTLYYVRGRLLKRYPPYIARYDNLWQVARILTVFSTQDGITWKQSYFALPDENDGPTAQHYGGSLYRVPDGNGLMISYSLPYSALMQQMHLELNHSWDGVDWRRVDGHLPWVPAGKPGDWNFGHTTPHNQIVERDGKWYHLIGWGTEIPHIGGDFLSSKEETAKLDGPYLERRYGQRDLMKWPFFGHYGSYEKLAQALKGMGVTPGVMVYRVDGWWALSAGAETATAQTRPVVAGGALTANVRVPADGSVTITLRDASGKPIDGFTRELVGVDNIAEPVFDTLPTGEFTVELTLKNAELFALNF